jgi:hypothetical protein
LRQFARASIDWLLARCDAALQEEQCMAEMVRILRIAW